MAAADRNCTSVTRECSSKLTSAIRLWAYQQGGGKYQIYEYEYKYEYL